MKTRLLIAAFSVSVLFAAAAQADTALPQGPATENPASAQTQEADVTLGLTDDQKKELILFGTHSMQHNRLGLRISSQEIEKLLAVSDLPKIVATGLILNGQTCDRMTKIDPPNLKRSHYEITCANSREGKNEIITYGVEAVEKGQVQNKNKP